MSAFFPSSNPLKPQASTMVPPPDAPPRRYVLFKCTQKCSCGSLHEFTELYSEHRLPSNWNKSAVRNLRPRPRIEFALPIEVISKPMVELPFCHECVMATSLSHLPPPPAEDTRLLGGLTAVGDALQRAAAAKKPKAAPATVDDIFALIGKE